MNPQRKGRTPMKKIEKFTTEEGLHVTGYGGGMLIFHPNGKVRVLYREEAVLASSHGSNRVGAKVVSGGELTSEFKTAARYALMKRQGFEFPTDADDPQVTKLLEIFRGDVWPLVLAMAEGDSKPLTMLAAAVENAKKLANFGVIQTVTFEQVASAVRRAAELYDRVPIILEIVNEFSSLAPSFEERGGDADSHVRKHLSKMGLGWLARCGVSA